MIPTLTFLAPGWLLAGGAAALLPILAHLFNLRRPRPAMFPGARFVRAALLSSARRSRPRDALLLAVRVLSIVLLACAFAQPAIVRSAIEPVAAPTHGADTVIILDASASMQRPRDGAPLFEHARAQARAALAELDPARDRAAVILASGRPISLLPRLTGNLSALQRRLNAARCTLEFGDAQAALDWAASILSPTSGRAARIIVLSDFQVSGWSGAHCAFPIIPRQLPPDQGHLGVSIDALSVDTTRVVQGSPARVTVRITDHRDGARAALVEAESPIGRSSALAALEAHGVGAVTFELPTREAGAFPLTITLPQSAAALGASRFAVLDVGPAAPTAIITSENVANLSEAASWIHAALSARSSFQSKPNITVLQPRDLAGPALRQFGALLLVACGALDDASIAALQARLSEGGSVIWMLDSGQSCASLARLLNRSGIDATCEASMADDTATFAIGEFLSDTVPSAMLAGITLHAPIAMPKGPAFETLATLGDGSPFIARISVGAADLNMVRADLTPAASDLAQSALLPILIDALLKRGASGMRPAPGAAIGEPLAVSIDPESARRLPPDARDSRGRPVGIELRETAAIAHLPPLDAPGFVSLLDENGDTLALAPVNIDARELETVWLSPAEQRAISPPGSPTGEPFVADAVDSREYATNLWPAAMVLALALLAVESWLLAATRRRASRLEGFSN